MEGMGKRTRNYRKFYFGKSILIIYLKIKTDVLIKIITNIQRVAFPLKSQKWIFLNAYIKIRFFRSMLGNHFFHIKSLTKIPSSYVKNNVIWNLMWSWHFLKLNVFFRWIQFPFVVKLLLTRKPLKDYTVLSTFIFK